ncbi:Threonine/homoserine/homoserine lactone efflux protein [Aliiroseovarius halocynthiae]|nr:Threonine/homoserine/homoserine lactone efflux protein [Aliiroseovarius halocynthiae]
MTPEFLLTALIVVLAPGTGVIYTLAIGLSRGKSAAVAASLGCTIGIVPALLAAILGLAAILHSSALMFQIVKFSGVAFLLYMAWQTLRDHGPLAFNSHPDQGGLGKIAVRGALLNVLNPKLSLFFLAFLPQFLTGNPESASSEMMILGGVFMAMTFVVFVVYGWFASAARDKILQSPRALAWLRRVFAASFAGLGAKLAFERA